ncbi:MAG: GNAT family N-acetyltransferase [Nitrososphaerota archaeon]|nr:GNAT family N-acetyltransferase [Nitrososphaerota archaeon]
MDIVVKESRDIDKVIKLFEQHKDTPFTYLMNIPLVKMLSQLEYFKIFVAEANGETVGCIHSLDYLYDCGYIGGLLVHRDYRKMGIGTKLMEAALSSLNAKHVYLFVEEKNTDAIRFFDKIGFRKIYRRFFYIATTTLNEAFQDDLCIKCDVEWIDLREAIGFSEREGIVNLGYYPIKVTRDVFEDLKARGKIFRFGNVIAIVEKSYGLTIGEYFYSFNDHITNRLHNFNALKNIFEVNPFYIRPEPSDLVKLMNHLVKFGEVHVKTYDGDSVVNKLPLTGKTGALTMEYRRA